MELYNKFSMEMILPNGELFKYETDRIEKLQIMNACFDHLNMTIIEPKYTKKDLIDFFNYVYEEFSNSIIVDIFDINYVNEFLNTDDKVKKLVFKIENPDLKNYTFKVTETFKVTLKVKASSIEEATEIAECLCDNGSYNVFSEEEDTDFKRDIELLEEENK